MKFLRLFACLAVLSNVLAAPMPASAVTINQMIAPPGSYSTSAGPGFVGLLLSLSTSDSWQTANFVVRIRSNFGGTEQIFLLNSAAPPNAIIASDFAGPGPIGIVSLSDPSLEIFFRANSNDRFSFTLYSLDPNYSVWNALTGGFSLWQGFFGNEYYNHASIWLDDPRVTSYDFQLGNAAAVPLPPAFALGLGALGFLSLFRRRKRKN